jgi:hypothetical protein
MKQSQRRVHERRVADLSGWRRQESAAAVSGVS